MQNKNFYIYLYKENTDDNNNNNDMNSINYKHKGGKLTLVDINKFKPDDRRNRIFLSPYDFEDTYSTFINADYISKNINLKYVVVNSEILYNVIPKLSATSISILFAILNNLEADTNIVKFNISEFSRNLNKYYNNVVATNKSLYEFGIISQTNKSFTYVINHNAFFKGNLEQFRIDYKELYGDRKAEFNDKNKIILQNY